jgi:hypothetical protein
LKTALYVALCLIVPPVWGLLSYWLFELIGLRRRRAAEAQEASPDGGETPEAEDAG